MKKSNLIWGLLLILAGAFLIVSKLGYLGDVNVFSVIVSVFLVYIIITSIVKVNFAGILFPLAFLAILYDKELGITSITPWTVLIAALLGSVGLSLVFHKHHHHHHNYMGCGRSSNSSEEIPNIDSENEGNIVIDNNFGSSVKYVNSNCFEQADIDSSFGALKVYFDKTVMKGESAVIKLDVSFSGVELYIPRGWRIQDNTNFSFGGVTEKNSSDGVITNTLILTGDVSFGGVDIFYV